MILTRPVPHLPCGTPENFQTGCNSLLNIVEQDTSLETVVLALEISITHSRSESANESNVAMETIVAIFSMSGLDSRSKDCHKLGNSRI